jgi:beta-xylosidase
MPTNDPSGFTQETAKTLLFPGFNGFTYGPAFPHEKGMTRRDPSPVVLVNGLYHVWYTRNPEADHGFSGTIWHAVSADGFQWKEEGEALGKGGPGAFDECGVFTPTLLIADGTYHLYYTAMPIGWYADRETTKGAIGLATAPSPFGPWTRFGGSPVLKTSDDLEAFDSLRVDDAVIIKRAGRYWMYYKGRPMGKPWTATQMGVAFADHPTGPWQKHQGNPIVGSGHEVCVWPHGKGVGCLVSDVGPEGNSLQFSEDGLHFFKIMDAYPPRAPGPFRTDGFAEVAGEGITWGLCIGEDAERPYLQRFDCDLRRPQSST